MPGTKETDKQTDRQIEDTHRPHRDSKYNLFCDTYMKYRQTDRPSDRETDKHITEEHTPEYWFRDTWTDGRTDGQTDEYIPAAQILENLAGCGCENSPVYACTYV